MNNIDIEIMQDNILDDLIRPFWKDMQRENKELEESLIEEITKENPEWVKDRRLEYLKLELDILNKEYIDKCNYIRKYRNKVDEKDDKSLYGVYNLFADLMENESNKQKCFFNSSHSPWLNKEIPVEKFLPDIAKKIDAINFEIKCWDNPGVDYNAGQYDEEEIDMARNADPERFIEFERDDGDRKWTKCLSNDEKNPSLCYYKDSKRFHCFSCGWNANCIDLVMKIYKTDFRSAINLILNK